MSILHSGIHKKNGFAYTTKKILIKNEVDSDHIKIPVINRYRYLVLSRLEL